MKVLAIGHLTGKDITPYLKAEGDRVTELRADGLNRPRPGGMNVTSSRS